MNRIEKTAFVDQIKAQLTLSLPSDTPYDIIIMWDFFMHVLYPQKITYTDM